MPREKMPRELMQFGWQAQYLVKVDSDFSWQAQYLVKLQGDGSWQTQHFVTFGSWSNRLYFGGSN